MVRGGHAQIPQHHKREPGFFAIKIQEHFEFEPRWYRTGEVSGLVLEYYYILRSVLRQKPHLRPCLSRCRHCGIAFLTHWRNAARGDLGCPFGCRQAHRRKRATERSTAYYQSENGKMKKKRQNAKRSKGRDPFTETEKAKAKESEESVKPEKPEKPMARAESAEATVAEGAAALEFDEDMVEHLRVQTSLLEERQVSREETIEMLRRVMRQRSMARESRRDYVVRFLKEKEENPP